MGMPSPLESSKKIVGIDSARAKNFGIIPHPYDLVGFFSSYRIQLLPLTIRLNIPPTPGPENAHPIPIHNISTGHRNDHTCQQDNHSHQQPDRGRGAGGNALTRLCEIEDVPCGTHPPTGHGTQTHTVDGIPLHPAHNAGVPRALIRAHAAAVDRFVVLECGTVVRLDGTAALTAHVFLDLHMAALGLRLGVGVLGDDHHDVDAFGAGGGRDAALGEEVATSAASGDRGEVGNDLDDVASVGDVLSQIDEGVSTLAWEHGFQDGSLLVWAAGALQCEAH